MLRLEEPCDLDDRWAQMVTQNPLLPPTLRVPQRDALYYLLQGRHVILNINTGLDLYLISG